MPQELDRAIGIYFAAEKQGGVLLATLGVIAVAFGVFAWRRGEAWRGAAVPVGIIGVIEVIVGATVFLRTDGQVRRLRQALEADLATGLAPELERMERVLRSFGQLKIAEIALLVGGLLLALLLWRRAGWRGAGLALALEAAAALGFDSVAAERAEVYVKALRAPVRAF
jgi:hypothetical protein